MNLNEEPENGNIGTNYIWPFKVLVFLGGVLLPLIALGVELVYRMCASTFFDPLPTPWHIFLVGLVPVSNLLIWRAIETKKFKYYPVFSWMNGIVLGITFFYSILFLPLTIVALFCIFFYGIGFLVFAPHLSFVAAVCCQIGLNKYKPPVLKKKQRAFRFWGGIILAILILFTIELPVLLTRSGLQMAAAGSTATHRQGIQWLRKVGDKNLMLRFCYVRPGTSDFFGLLFAPVNPEEARKIYYQVTGTPFNSVPPPRFNVRGRNPFDETTFDIDQGGDAVAGRIKNLSLATSRIDGSVDPEAALAYLEWTMVFQNTDEISNREARAQISLPPGAIVSRLTLWVNGEEREAAFAAHGKVRAAYQKVVQRQRDPVLVTVTGPDRILVQCFPVSRDHGEMKIRLGITTPLFLDKPDSAILRLPLFVERNFNIPEKIGHAVWIEAKTPLTAVSKYLKAEHPSGKSYIIRGLVPDRELGANLIRGKRSQEKLQAWTLDSFMLEQRIVRQSVIEKRLSLPKMMILVLDGSRSIAKYQSTIAALLPELPAGIEFCALVAADQVTEISGPLQKSSRKFYQTVGNRLQSLSFTGGQDNLPALSRAMDLTAGTAESAIIWIHGPQPVLLSPIEHFTQYWDRQSTTPDFYEISTENGPDLILEKLNQAARVTTVPRFGSFQEDLSKLFTRWTKPQFLFIRESLPCGATVNPDDKTSAHLARLWGRDRVYQLIAERKDRASLQEAVKVAVAYQIVTPVTGAVVLENASQYQEAGLEPVDPGTVPTIPEPGTWGLIAISIFFLGFFIVQQRRIKCNQNVI